MGWGHSRRVGNLCGSFKVSGVHGDSFGKFDIEVQDDTIA